VVVPLATVFKTLEAESQGRHIVGGLEQFGKTVI